MHTSCDHAWQVILPHIHFNDDETNALQDPDTVQEVQAMRQSHDACFQVSQVMALLQHWMQQYKPSTGQATGICSSVHPPEGHT